MKHVSLLLLTTALTFGAVQAQNEMDAYRYSKNDLTGTARSVSMGGAFGALGGDISGISINPAGIGVYQSSEIVTTLNFQNSKVQTEMNAGKVDESKFKVNFDNLAFVSVFPIFDNDVVRSINIGFSYNRLKNFDRKYNAIGNNLSYDLAAYMADRATNNGRPASAIALGDEGNDWRDIWRNQDWLSVLAFNGHIIDEKTPAGSGQYVPASPEYAAYSDLFVEEKGSISTYDFNIGTTFSDIVSVGATLSLTDINYRIYSSYIEEYQDNGSFWSSQELQNWMRTDGTGWQVTAGVIVKPIQELRIGVSYHSPTWYNMTDYFAADLSSNFADGAKFNIGSFSDPNSDRSEDAIYDYKMRTPDKWTLSLAGVIGGRAIISADYELTNYANNMKLFDDRGNALATGTGDPNAYIKNDFRNASTVRVGAEYRITDQFSARVGYSWMQSPFKNEVKDFPGDHEVVTDSRAATQYVLDGTTNYFTYGMGYRFSRHFYTDIAFVMKSQKDDLYAFTGADKSTFKTNNFQGLLTLGYRF
ncbi:MAG: OmpP1/FadL family transporter [Dysgonomonas sp.]|jgi:long-subunit fatty acid transport protein|uniref:OmpP1/FadL family transporter n=1 Tax=unclassified Dysgonomonas TaxID=2630389 RepID=UPI0025BBDAD2|nr:MULTISPECIES: outer membrane protein transport protein [unclassified Dysgonomonas]MDR1718234.1 outer membrane protein transport protein [Prevotella sp.]HMM03013.1 outer membrane protein transport protein [Dysgonomonas sp.]